jgi:hypothetical protein
MTTLADRVKGKVTFSHFTLSELWYKTDDGFEFPVHIDDTGNGIYMAEDKAIYFMRFIRSHMALVDKAKLQQQQATVEPTPTNLVAGDTNA